MSSRTSSGVSRFAVADVGVDEEKLKDLLEDVVEALANKRLMQKQLPGKVGVELTTRLIDRCKVMLYEISATEEG